MHHKNNIHLVLRAIHAFFLLARTYILGREKRPPPRMRMKRKHESTSKASTPNNVQQHDRYEVVHLADRHADQLPSFCPRRFSFFRFLAFRILKNGQPLRSRAHLTLQVIDDDGDGFDITLKSSFRGVYYFQDVALNTPGTHLVQVHASNFSTSSSSSLTTTMVPKVIPFSLAIQVYECLDLDQCQPEFRNSRYGPLMTLIDAKIASGTEAELRDDYLFHECTRHLIKEHGAGAGSGIPRPDIRRWIRNYFLRQDEQERVQSHTAYAFSVEGTRRHSRKQQMPVRAGSEKEHTAYFQGKPRARQRRSRGQVRIFTQEPLAANTTVMVYATDQLNRQLRQYAEAS